MLKFYESMATLSAVLRVLMFLGATGAVETDQWVLLLALFVMGTCTTFLSIVCQEKK